MALESITDVLLVAVTIYIFSLTTTNKSKRESDTHHRGQKAGPNQREKKYL